MKLKPAFLLCVLTRMIVATVFLYSGFQLIHLCHIVFIYYPCFLLFIYSLGCIVYISWSIVSPFTFLLSPYRFANHLLIPLSCTDPGSTNRDWFVEPGPRQGQTNPIRRIYPCNVEPYLQRVYVAFPLYLPTSQCVLMLRDFIAVGGSAWYCCYQI